MVRVNKPEYNIIYIYIYIDIQCPSLHLPTGWGEYWWKAIHKALWHQAGDGLLVPAQPYELCESPQVSKWVPVRHVPPNCLQCELVGTPQTESNSGWSNESPISTPMGPMVMTTTVPLPHKQIRTWSWSYTCLCFKKTNMTKPQPRVLSGEIAIPFCNWSPHHMQPWSWQFHEYGIPLERVLA